MVSGDACCIARMPLAFTLASSAAEVGAVLTRLAPEQSLSLFQALLARELPMTMEWVVYEEACRLAINLNHHLFDTLYHAVALHSSDAIFITDDTQYFRKAVGLGQIIELKDFPSL